MCSATSTTIRRLPWDCVPRSTKVQPNPFGQFRAQHDSLVPSRLIHGSLADGLQRNDDGSAQSNSAMSESIRTSSSPFPFEGRYTRIRRHESSHSAPPTSMGSPEKHTTAAHRTVSRMSSKET
ncbi:hypothetical protein PWT90_11225 [Aphanocladium album]|nr:hypothetical protein PWT90_11225 [Aphanocladium album]